MGEGAAIAAQGVQDARRLRLERTRPEDGDARAPDPFAFLVAVPFDRASHGRRLGGFRRGSTDRACWTRCGWPLWVRPIWRRCWTALGSGPGGARRKARRRCRMRPGLLRDGSAETRRRSGKTRRPPRCKRPSRRSEGSGPASPRWRPVSCATTSVVSEARRGRSTSSRMSTWCECSHAPGSVTVTPTPRRCTRRVG